MSLLDELEQGIAIALNNDEEEQAWAAMLVYADALEEAGLDGSGWRKVAWMRKAPYYGRSTGLGYWCSVDYYGQEIHRQHIGVKPWVKKEYLLPSGTIKKLCLGSNLQEDRYSSHKGGRLGAVKALAKVLSDEQKEL